MKRFYLLSVISLFSAGISAQEITGGERTLSADSIITSDARLDSIYQLSLIHISEPTRH